MIWRAVFFSEYLYMTICESETAIGIEVVYN